MQIEDIITVIAQCEAPGYTFGVQTDGRGEMYLQARYEEPDTITGKPSIQLTRRWFLSPKMTKSEVVQTCFKCLMTSYEHQAREWFRYRGQPVYNPHYEVDALVDLCKAGRFSGRAQVSQRED